MVVWRIQRADKTKTAGYVTAVGFFHKNSSKLSEDNARAVDTGNSLGRISIRSDDEAFNLPRHVETNLLAYTKKKDKHYFIAEFDRPPTPLPINGPPRPPSSQRPRSAGSTAQSSAKKRRPNTAEAQEVQAQQILPKTNKNWR
jgi:hypothetical protein